MAKNLLVDSEPTHIPEITVDVLWNQPRNEVILVQHENQVRLMPHTFWMGQRSLKVSQADFNTFAVPELSAVIAQAGLTADALTAIFARTGIISPETVTPEAVQQVIILLLNQVASNLK